MKIIYGRNQKWLLSDTDTKALTEYYNYIVIVIIFFLMKQATTI